MVGKKKFGYGTKGVAKAKSYAKKTGKKMSWQAQEEVSVNYRGERFSAYNKPKRTPGKSKKFAVLAKDGDKVRLVRFGDPNMSIKKNIPARVNPSERGHKCDEKKSKLTAGYWSCKEMVNMSLYKNIHAKRKRIKKGSGEKMRKPGSKGAPTAKAFKKAA